MPDFSVSRTNMPRSSRTRFGQDQGLREMEMLRSDIRPGSGLHPGDEFLGLCTVEFFRKDGIKAHGRKRALDDHVRQMRQDVIEGDGIAAPKGGDGRNE